MVPNNNAKYAKKFVEMHTGKKVSLHNETCSWYALIDPETSDIYVVYWNLGKQDMQIARKNEVSRRTMIALDINKGGRNG